MADSPLNHSWPSFSKIWMKRWSFKRASECKPCSHQSCGNPSTQLSVQGPSGKGSSSSLPPASITEDVFSDNTSDDQDASSVLSDYDCPCVDAGSSLEDLQGLSSSLRDSEYFKDLQGESPASQAAASKDTSAFPESNTQQTDNLQEPVNTNSQTKNQLTALTTDFLQVNATSFPSFEQFADEPPSDSVAQLSPKPLPGCVADGDDFAASALGLNWTVNLNGLLESLETVKAVEELDDIKDKMDKMELDGEPEMDSFPILVRSMSTSRRHSWGVPLSPLNSDRRLSLDTAAIDSDEDGDDDDEQQSSLFQSSQQQPDSFSTGAGDEPDGFSLRVTGRQLYSRSDILATDEYSRAAHISRVVQTSKQAARAAGVAEEFDPEENLHSSEGQSHMLMVQKVLQELKLYYGAKHRNNSSPDTKDSGSVTWYEFLSNANEGEEDRAEKVEKGTKVKRTLSSLRSRVTGSFNKDKGKNREKELHRERAKERDREAKEKVCRTSSSNGHCLVPGAFSSSATCSLCSKSLLKKHGMQCMNCAVNVHKSCKSLLGECTSSKNKRDFHSRGSGSASPSLALKDRDREKDQAGRDWAQAADGHRGFPGVPGMTVAGSFGASTQSSASLSSSFAAAPACIVGPSFRHHSRSGSLPGDMDEIDSLRSKRCNDDAVSLAPSIAESIIVEDAHYAAVRADLESDAQDLEADSWSLAVDQHYLKKHSKDVVKRQDVIYELMQTEMHHVRTLKIMLRVYVREMKENLHMQVDSGRLDCLFPRLENLLDLHTHFLSCLRERRRENLVSPSDRNYTINRVADILIAQFSGEIGERMKNCYGDFCSHHTEAVSLYKELLQNNRRFQNLIRKISNLSIVRRLGVTECILLVTQRITKYPVLVERILHNTEANTEEHQDLTRALSLIKETIKEVDTLVNLHEKESRLRDIHSKMEPKTQGKIKDGRVFRREDLAQGRRWLLHEGTVSWKAASGRLKDILAVLLSDVLLLLQEKDQRYIFATVDNKPSVISLQKLIVREVAHEEKAMFLICASSNEPEMYEIHTASKEERNSWMTYIRQAVESCPHSDERLFSEEEEARAARLREFQERLSQRDAVIAQALAEKLQLFAEMAESVAGLEDTASRSKLLLRGDALELQQGEVLLKGAITEVENLQNLLQAGVKEEAEATRAEDESGSGVLPRRAGTFGGYDSSPVIFSKNGSVKKSFSGGNRDRSQRASSDPQLKGLCGSHTLEQTVGAEQVHTHKVDQSCSSPPRWNRIWSNSFPEAEFFDKVLMLSQRLYSLQAIVSQQDSQIELQKASLTERVSLPGRNKGNGLLEQEKQRTLALQREELAYLNKLQSQHRQEQQRWEKERERHRQQVEATEARLRQREEECRKQEEQLAKEKEELDRQRETYQKDLERLRESTRAVEKEKERLESQKKMKRKTIEVAPISGSPNGDLLSSSGLSSSTCVSELPHSQKPVVRGSLSVAQADYPERPEVMLRRDTGSSTLPLPLKTEVPLHLFSTTNQQHKPVGVQQQIPTKLAAINSGKGKGSKSGKASHRTNSSASVDLKQIVPLKMSAIDDNVLKAKRSISPHQQPLQSHSLHHHSDQLSPEQTGLDTQPTSSISSTQKPPMQGVQPHPPPSVHHLHSQSADSLPFQPHLQPHSLSQIAQANSVHGLSVTPPYSLPAEDLNKEDVIFF